MAHEKTAAVRVAARYQAMRMRDLFEGAPPQEEEITLRVMADYHPEYEVLEPQFPDIVAQMPGDEGVHPFAQVRTNPFPGMSQQALMAALQDETMPRPMRLKVRDWLATVRAIDEQQNDARVPVFRESNPDKKQFEFVPQYFAGRQAHGCGVVGHKVGYWSRQNMFGCVACDTWTDARPVNPWPYEEAPDKPSLAHGGPSFVREPDR